MANRSGRTRHSSPRSLRPKAVTETSEEPMALISGMAVAPISPGTIRKPPPMPKKPDSAPTAKPMPISSGNSFGMLSRVSCTSALPPDLRGRSIVSPTTTISTPNSIKQAAAVHHLAEMGAAGRAGDAG